MRSTRYRREDRLSRSLAQLVLQSGLQQANNKLHQLPECQWDHLPTGNSHSTDVVWLYPLPEILPSPYPDIGTRRGWWGRGWMHRLNAKGAFLPQQGGFLLPPTSMTSGCIWTTLISRVTELGPTFLAGLTQIKTHKLPKCNSNPLLSPVYQFTLCSLPYAPYPICCFVFCFLFMLPTQSAAVLSETCPICCWASCPLPDLVCVTYRGWHVNHRLATLRLQLLK